MDIDGPGWILDVEKAGEKNAVNIARLFERVDQLQDDVRQSREESRERSNDRLEIIMDRFDQAETLGSRRLGVAASFFVAVFTAIWFVIVQPLKEQTAILERRMLDAERTIAVLDASSE